MERILSEDERMRRAEEIYFRRNNRNINLVHEEIKREKKYSFSRIFLNMIILFNISIIIFCFQNKDFIFTKEFQEECEQYNVDINKYLSGIMNNFLEENSGIVGNNSEENVNILNENKIENDNSISNNTINGNQGSATIEQNITNTDMSSVSEMDLDIENLKKSYSFIKPISATVSSCFGARESEYQNVNGYHTGIDLASEKGTSIKASMEGIVELVSNKGDYRKTYKNKM